jgi:hypothetical protein
MSGRKTEKTVEGNKRILEAGTGYSPNPPSDAEGDNV